MSASEPSETCLGSPWVIFVITSGDFSHDRPTMFEQECHHDDQVSLWLTENTNKFASVW